MKKGDKCYNEEIICPHQIDNEPCGYCEYRPQPELLIFTGKKPENPCEGCSVRNVCGHTGGKAEVNECIDLYTYNIQLSILNQCVEIPLNKIYNEYQDYLDYGDYTVSQTFEEFAEQFIQSEKQEGKDHVSK